MPNPISVIAIAFVLVAPCIAFAKDRKQNIEVDSYSHTILPTGKRMNKPPLVTNEVDSLMTQNKPVNPTVKPAHQGNALQKKEGWVSPPQIPDGI